VRVLREYPDLLEAQLRAVLKVSQQFRIGVLIPMVTTESDVVCVVELFHRLAAEMGIRELPRIGAMIETPAAALSIHSLKKHVDFLSIGSNDLTQYTMAAGRENPLAGRIDVIPRLLRTGIRSLSVAAALVPDVRNAIRNSSP
jgi:phosphoenolpyruvate-protein kinase (PTS system EI component)